MPSVILNDTILKGTLSQKDSITIDGTFIGNISAEEIIVKNLGTINGNLNASVNIEVNGNVVGDLNSDKIHLTSSANVKGKLFNKSLSVDEGAQLDVTAQTRKRISNLNKE
jgi:cytoskeletal protein CcmA (bactofilin family)